MFGIAVRLLRHFCLLGTFGGWVAVAVRLFHVRQADLLIQYSAQGWGVTDYNLKKVFLRLLCYLSPLPLPAPIYDFHRLLYRFNCKPDEIDIIAHLYSRSRECVQPAVVRVRSVPAEVVLN